MTDGSDGFLSRWSRRKLRARTQDNSRSMPPDVASSAEAPVPQRQEPERHSEEQLAPGADVEAESEAEVLERLGLPDPDTLGKGDDFSGFMQAGVPEVIRRRALRRLWRSNPTLAVLDGLNDYDDDFTGGFVPPGKLNTLYKVGRGILSTDSEDVQDTARSGADERDVMTGATQPKLAAEIDEKATGETEAEEQPLEAKPEESKEIIAVQAEAEEADADETESEPRATRRRMTFQLPGV